jgi:hypothetical protein
MKNENHKKKPIVDEEEDATTALADLVLVSPDRSINEMKCGVKIAEENEKIDNLNVIMIPSLVDGQPGSNEDRVRGENKVRV